MAVSDRIEDAKLLWTHGHRESAFLVSLIAVAATSRKRFPDRMGCTDREAFERFLEEANSVRLSVENRGECHPIKHVLYKWFRCQLVHEGEFPIDIEFMPAADPGVLSVRAGGSPHFVLIVSESWFHFLVGTVTAASENKGLLQS